MSFARANIIKPNALFNFSITEFGKRSAICEEGIDAKLTFINFLKKMNR